MFYQIRSSSGSKFVITKVILKPWVSLLWISYPCHLASGTFLRFSDVDGNGGFWWGIPLVTEISQVERSPFLSKYREYMYGNLVTQKIIKNSNLRFRGVSRPPYVFYFKLFCQGDGMEGQVLEPTFGQSCLGYVGVAFISS